MMAFVVVPLTPLLLTVLCPLVSVPSSRDEVIQTGLLPNELWTQVHAFRIFQTPELCSADDRSMFTFLFQSEYFVASVLVSFLIHKAFRRVFISFLLLFIISTRVICHLTHCGQRVRSSWYQFLYIS